MNKYRILLNGSEKDVNAVDYISNVANWKNFLPTTKRNSKYHGFVQRFSNKELIFMKGSRTYLKTLFEARGSFASVTFKIQRFSFSSEEYLDIVDGSLDFGTYSDDEVAGTLVMLFQTSLDEEALLSRAKTRTSLHSLTSFDGESISSFSGDHGESYSLSVTKTEIDNFTEEATSLCDVMLVWEVALRLAQKIIGRDDCLRSTLLGRENGESFTYDADGELSYLAFTVGGLMRGGSKTEYPIRISLDELFDILNAITPVGLDIEYINDEAFLVIEKVEYFYDNQNGVTWDIDPPESLRFVTANDRRYGKVLSGYRQYEKTNEDTGGVSYEETLHADRSWITGLDKVTRNAYNIRINAIASSQLIETIRSNPITDLTNDQFNKEILLLQLSRSGATWSIDNSYVSETGVNNPASQKNYKITPGRCILNHLKLINGCLNSEYKYKEATEIGFSGWAPINYQVGSGNSGASVRLSGEDSEILENADLSAGVEPIFYDKNIEVGTSITEDLYENIKNNLNKWVRIKYNGSSYYGYIDEIQFSSINSLSLICKFANIDYQP